MKWIKAFFGLLINAGIKFTNDNCQRFAASLSYYMVFSLAPFLVIVVAVLGLYYEGDARLELVSKITDVAGEQIGGIINNLILSISNPFQTAFASIIALGTFLIGASRVLVELRSVLNTIWGFAQKEDDAVGKPILQQILYFLFVRIFTILMLLVIGFVILALLFISTYFSVMNSWLAANMPDVLYVSVILDPLFTIGTTTGFFYLLMRILPAYRPPRRNVLVGAFVAAILFNFGQTLFSIYIARAAVTSLYGAASSLTVLMLWIYFSSSIFLYGAQLAATLRLNKLKREKEKLENQRANREKLKNTDKEINVSDTES